MSVHDRVGRDLRHVSGGLDVPSSWRKRHLLRRRVAGLLALAVVMPLMTLNAFPGVAGAASATKAKATQTMTIYPGVNASEGIVAGPDGALWFTNESGGPENLGSIGRITTAGVVTNYSAASITARQGLLPAPTVRCGSRTSTAMPSDGSRPPAS